MSNNENIVILSLKEFEEIVTLLRSMDKTLEDTSRERIIVRTKLKELEEKISAGNRDTIPSLRSPSRPNLEIVIEPIKVPDVKINDDED